MTNHITQKMSKKFWVRCQNAHPESFWTSSNDSIPRIRTLRDRISRGMTVVRFLEDFWALRRTKWYLDDWFLILSLLQNYLFIWKIFISFFRKLVLLCNKSYNQWKWIEETPSQTGNLSQSEWFGQWKTLLDFTWWKICHMVW